MLSKLRKKIDEIVKDPWHQTSSDVVFDYEVTGAGCKVWFEKAYVDTHEETGEKRVRTRYRNGPNFFTTTDWKLATTMTDEQDTYSVIVMRGEHKPSFPKDEYIEEMQQS